MSFRDVLVLIVYGIVYLVDLYGVSVRIDALRACYNVSKKHRDNAEMLRHWIWLLMMLAATVLVGALILMKILEVRAR